MLIKRILAALICAATFTTVLASCGGGNDTPASGGNDTTAAGGDAADTTVAEETTTAELSAYDYLPEKTYDGKSYTVYTPETGTRYLPGQILTTEETGDVIMDAAYIRNRNVEDKFDIKIKHITAGSDYYTGIRSAVQSGDNTYDLTAGFLTYMANLGVEPIFMDVANLPYIDVENPWYGKANEALQIKGKQSLFFSDYTCITLSCTYGLFYNKNLGNEYNIPDLTQVVIDGGWVIDDMLKYTQGVSKDLDGNGTFDFNDQYGNISYTHHGNANGDTAVTYQYGMGNFTTVMDDEGMPVIALNNEKQYNIVQKLYTLFYEDNRTVQGNHEKGGNGFAKMFANGQGLFFNAIIMHAPNHLRDMEDDYMVLPLPKYDEAQESYYTSISQASSFLYGIPMSVADPEYSAVIFDALSYEGYKNVIPAFFEISMKVKYSRDDLTSQVFDLLRDNTHVDFGFIYGGNGMSKLISKVISAKSTDFASAYAALESSALDTYNKVIEQLTK